MDGLLLPPRDEAGAFCFVVLPTTRILSLQNDAPKEFRAICAEVHATHKMVLFLLPRDCLLYQIV